MGRASREFLGLPVPVVRDEVADLVEPLPVAKSAVVGSDGPLPVVRSAVVGLVRPLPVARSAVVGLVRPLLVISCGLVCLRFVGPDEAALGEMSLAFRDVFGGVFASSMRARIVGGVCRRSLVWDEFEQVIFVAGKLDRAKRELHGR